jgi:FHA domain
VIPAQMDILPNRYGARVVCCAVVESSSFSPSPVAGDAGWQRGGGSRLELEGSPDPEFAVEIPFGFDEVLGRDPSAGITIADPGVSRRHARVVHDDSGVWIADLGSTNGTFLNGERLVSPTQLHDGDQLRFGDSVAFFRNVEPVAVPEEDEDATSVIDALQTADHRVHPVEERMAGSPGPPSQRCGNCGSEDVSGRWFCGRCGDQLKPFAFPPVVREAAGSQPGYEHVVSSSGKVRHLAFRRVMRQSNGGRGVRFDAPLSAWTMTFRTLLIALVLVAMGVGVAAANGAFSNLGG